MQGDGNFVIYVDKRQPIWAPTPADLGPRPYRLAMQADGNLVVLWIQRPDLGQRRRSGTGPIGSSLQDDGNLVVYGQLNSRIIWTRSAQ